MVLGLVLALGFVAIGIVFVCTSPTIPLSYFILAFGLILAIVYSILLIKRRLENRNKLSFIEKTAMYHVFREAQAMADMIGDSSFLDRNKEWLMHDTLRFVHDKKMVNSLIVFYVYGIYNETRASFCHKYGISREKFYKVSILKNHTYAEIYAKYVKQYQAIIVSLISVFPPENTNLNRNGYCDLIAELFGTQTDDEVYDIVCKYGVKLPESLNKQSAKNNDVELTKSDVICDWLSKSAQLINDSTIESVKTNVFTEIDFLIYYMFTKYTIFCAVNSQASAERYNKITFEWFMQYVPSKYKIQNGFAEEFYWDRIEKYDELMRLDADKREQALGQAYQQFIRKDCLNQPFEKKLIIGNFLESFNYSVEACNLINEISKLLVDDFEQVCNSFKN